MTPQELVIHYQQVELMAEIGSWRWEPSTGRLWWSPGMHAIFGTTIEDFDGSIESLIEAAVPEDRHIFADAAKRYEETGEPELLRYRIQRPDGSIRSVWAFGETVEEAAVTIARGYVIDVTDRVGFETRLREDLDRAEERVAMLVANSPLPTILSADDGEVLRVNARWTELTGYRREEIPTLRDWTNKAYGERSAEILAMIEGVFDRSSAIDGDEIELTARDGTRRRCLFSAAPLGRLRDGRRVMISMARDVTAVRALEREHREQKKRLYQAQKLESLGVLAGGIAHDFNNLLTGVIGNVSLALDIADPEDTLYELLVEIGSAADHAAALSRDMLTYAGKQAQPRSAIAVDDGVRALRTVLRSSVPRGCELSFELNAGAARALIARDQLEQIAINLVSNAGEACGASGARIVLRSGTEELSAADLESRYPSRGGAPGRYVFIEVEDCGEGMDPETAARMFEPFFSTRRMGRGLGLAVVLGVLRGAGGVVAVDTEPCRGTRIRLSLPLIEPRATADRSRRPVDDEARRRLVLIVDDEPVVLRALSRMLDRLGYDVLSASDGAAALAMHAAAETKPDAAIVDLTMPSMGGDEVLRALKERQPDLPVILATGYSRGHIKQSEGELGHDGFLAKPFELRELERRLREVLVDGGESNASHDSP